MKTAASLPAMLTVSEVAELISKSHFTVRKLARLGALPGAKRVGNEWRFQRPALERYLSGGLK